jgi:hypothetical protein
VTREVLEIVRERKDTARLSVSEQFLDEVEHFRATVIELGFHAQRFAHGPRGTGHFVGLLQQFRSMRAGTR